MDRATSKIRFIFLNIGSTLEGMKKWINTYFDFTKREFNGLLLLMALILAVMWSPSAFSLFWPVKNDPEADALAIRQLDQMQKDSLKKWKKEEFRRSHIARKESVLFHFDPNQLGQEGWQKLGFSLKQAESIVKYRENGGQFRKPEDLKKLFVVSSAMYEKLKSYIDITILPADSNVKTNYRKPVQQASVSVEINSADTLDLEKIKGIGPAFARRIIKYRERLGGFYKKEQMMEVFGLDSAKFIEIREQTTIDLLKLKKLRVNTAAFEDLKNHPYLRYKQINAIIEYRKQHGNYVNIADLKKVAILTPQLIEKLEPYLIFNHD